jgi:TPR repeat protein
MNKIAISLLGAAISMASLTALSAPTTDKESLVEIQSRSEFVRGDVLQSNGFVHIREVTDKADSGDKEANLLLSKLYYYGVYYNEDVSKALEHAHLAADLSKGSYLWDLRIRQINSEVPHEDWMEAAFMDVPEALFVVGNHYLEDGPNQDMDLAWFFISRSASRGYERAVDQRMEMTTSIRNEMSISQRISEARGGSVEGLRELGEAYIGGLHAEYRKQKSEEFSEVVRGFLSREK